MSNKWTILIRLYTGEDHATYEFFGSKYRPTFDEAVAFAVKDGRPYTLESIARPGA